MTKDGSTKIKNIITPEAGVVLLGRGQISHTVKMHHSKKKILFNRNTQ